MEPVTCVHMLDRNTGKYIDVTVPIDSETKTFAQEGSCAIAGVDGTAAELNVKFLNPAGAKTGCLLPTGRCLDVLTISPVLESWRQQFLTYPIPWFLYAPGILACPLTSASAISVAAALKGSVVQQMMHSMEPVNHVRIGHPSGIMTMVPEVKEEDWF